MRTTTLRAALLVAALAVSVAGFALAGDDADEKGIEQAVQNYVSSH